MKIRLHPSIILENLISSLGIIIIIFIYLVVDDINSEKLDALANLASEIPFIGVLIAILIFIGLMLIFAVYFFFRWYNTYVYFNNDTFVIESGKLFKKKSSFHLKDIATVNIKQNILEKLLNTANMKIVLNMNDENNFKGKLLFKQNIAINIKNQILGKEVEEEEKFDSLFNFNFKDIIVHLFLSFNILSIIILILVYIPIVYGILYEGGFGSIFLTVIVTIIFIGSIIVSSLKIILNYYDFRVTREDDTIKLSHGALTTYKYSIPIKKINSVMVKRTLQAKIFDYYLVEVVNAGMNEIENEKTIISLYVKKDRLEEIFGKLLPEYQNNIELNKQPLKAFGTYLLSKVILFIIALVLMPMTKYLSLLLIPLIFVIAFMQYKFKKIGIDDNFLILESGFFEEKNIILAFRKIELIAFEKGVSSKITNLWSVRANIVGNLTNSSFKSGYFTKETMKNIEISY